MSDAPEEIIGDKLRKALIIVWLANKFDRKIQISKLRRLIGYDSSGLYSAMDSGWFKEENGRLLLTEKANSYLQKNLLTTHSLIRRLLTYMAVFPLINLFQWFLLTYYNLYLVFNPYGLLAAIFILFFFAMNWYRIYWWLIKTKNSE